MKIYTYSQARQSLSEVLDSANRDRVTIRRRRGECFEVVRVQVPVSPLDVPGVKTKANMGDVLKAIRESRVR